MDRIICNDYDDAFCYKIDFKKSKVFLKWNIKLDDNYSYIKMRNSFLFTNGKGTKLYNYD